MLMTVIELAAAQVLVLLAASLPGGPADADVAVSALGIAVQVTSICQVVPFGICIVLSIRVANELGARRPAAVRRAIHVGMANGAVVTVVTTAILLGAHRGIADVFTDNADVTEAAARCLLIVGAFLPPVVASMLVVGVICECFFWWWEWCTPLCRRALTQSQHAHQTLQTAPGTSTGAPPPALSPFTSSGCRSLPAWPWAPRTWA